MFENSRRVFIACAGMGHALVCVAAGCLPGCLPGDELAIPSGAGKTQQTEGPAQQGAVNPPPAEPPHSEDGLPSGSSGSPEVLIRLASQLPAEGDGTGAFRTTCLFSHMRHDDPIEAPGAPHGSHLHAFFGNTRADADSTAASLLTTGSSTCRGGIANRTAYWVPALLDASGAPRVPEPAQIYYKSGYDGIAASSIAAFPAGLRIVAGDPLARAAQEAAHWSCDRSPGERVGSIPACAPGDRLSMTVEFPQCWNGRDLDAPDHTSHMAYPVDGQCPASHPVAIPAITLNVPYIVPPEGTLGFRLDSDVYDTSLPGGFSAHGDWFDAWDPELVATWVPRCINAGLDCHSHLLGDGRETYFSPKDSAAGDE